MGRSPAGLSVQSASTELNGLGLPFSNESHSPNPDVAPDSLQELEMECGEMDARLNAVAQWLAHRGSMGPYGKDVDRLTFAIRAAGAPYVWPAAWTRSWKGAADDPELRGAFSSWLRHFELSDVRRCGLAISHDGDSHAVSAVVTVALADLETPLPMRTRVGQWLRFEARLHVAANQAKVILLGPTGEPEAIPTEQAGDLVKARFAAKSPGMWLVQLLATGETGPRPMLESILFADVSPREDYADEPVPGERPALDGEAPAGSIDRMMTEMRRQTGRPALHRDPILDRLASEHAHAMHLARRIGHDIGSGATHARLTAGGFHARLAGENVAHAADAIRTHRALWASPSHRSNLLHRGFSRWGLGVDQDEDGSLWVCELFASER